MRPRLQPLLLILPGLFFATPALACGPTGEEFVLLGAAAISVLALPYALVGMIAALSLRRRLFPTHLQPLRPAIWAGVKSYGISWLGLLIAAGLAFSLHELGMLHQDEATLGILLSTPLVILTAYFGRLYQRRQR